MNDEKYYEWEELVRKTAYFVSKDFPETTEDDLFQDLMLYVLSNKKLKDPEATGIAKSLYRKATSIAWDYRKQGLYISAQYAYRTSDVRRMLETVFDYEDWPTAYIPEDARSERNDDWLVVHADLKSAFEALPERYQDAILLRYQSKISPTVEADKRRLARAIERLTDTLNFYSFQRDREYVGTRKVISNAAAQFRIQEQDG